MGTLKVQAAPTTHKNSNNMEVWALIFQLMEVEAVEVDYLWVAMDYMGMDLQPQIALITLVLESIRFLELTQEGLKEHLVVVEVAQEIL